MAILDRLNYLINIFESDQHVLQPVDEHHTTDGVYPGVNEHHTTDGVHPGVNEHHTADGVHPGVNVVLPDLVLKEPELSPPPGTVGSTTSITTHLEPTRHSSSAESADKHALPQYFHGSSEDILDWPVFQSRHNREQIERLIFDPALHSDHDYSSPSNRSRFSAPSPAEAREEPRRRMSSTRGIREEDVSELVERFLNNVHTKNPILDSNALRGIVKSIAGDGFGWDARTCLVVSTCPCSLRVPC